MVTSSNQQQFDLLSGIQRYIRDSGVKYIHKYVKGHSDDDIKIKDLDR